MTSKQIGDFGESAACEWLEKHGISVLKRNYRCRTGEIDIIAKDNETIAFCEVKTRRSTGFGTPAEAVDFRKQRKIVEAALYYLGRDDLDIRFDVIEVMYTLSGGAMKVTGVNYIKSAFMGA